MSAPAPDQVVVVLTTVGDLEQGKALARDLVRSGRAACVTLLPGASSIYRWEERLVEEGEIVLVIKTPRDRLESLKEELGERHPYDVPELLVLGVSEGSAQYVAWMRDSTRSPLEER